MALEEGDNSTAEQIAVNALGMAEGLGRQELIASNCRLLAKALARQGRGSEGLPHAERALEICRQLKRSDLLIAAQEAWDECNREAFGVGGRIESPHSFSP
jgi:hypothetical protein